MEFNSGFKGLKLPSYLLLCAYFQSDIYEVECMFRFRVYRLLINAVETDSYRDQIV